MRSTIPLTEDLIADATAHIEDDILWLGGDVATVDGETVSQRFNRLQAIRRHLLADIARKNLGMMEF